MAKSDAQTTAEAYIEYYGEQLEEMIGQRTVEMAPAYDELQRAAMAHLEQLAKEWDSELNADLKRSRKYTKKIQEAFLTQLIPELQLLNAKLEPFATAVIAGTVFFGANTTAHLLEQAAKTPVTITNLTRSGVLGIIANPWLPDGRNYSDRIRANTALVATNAEKTIKNLVTKKLSYNEAARELSDKIGESYSNATRIVRTEMTRANALGSSYSMLDNADILDGKYRDAVYDSRTAAYCAADSDYSKKHPYDLDYDTPSNPGVPGKRIPNHPNCRCRWVPCIKALGAKERGKIARKNDSKTSWGENYYTEATSYDDYAKERGLPSVKDMVNHDDPKRYLRPGETVEDIYREVKRQDFGGHSIVVPNQTSKSLVNNCLVDNSVKSSILKVQQTPTLSTGYTRKTANTGAFKVLEEPLQKKHVKQVIAEMGIDYENITIKVVREEYLIGMGLYGYTFPDGKKVQLYPDAFTSREQLVKTLAHERQHVEQVRLLGETWDSDELKRREDEAYAVEAVWWEAYQKGR